MLQFDKHFPCCINGLKGMSSIETFLYYEILMIKKKNYNSMNFITTVSSTVIKIYLTLQEIISTLDMGIFFSFAKLNRKQK